MLSITDEVIHNVLNGISTGNIYKFKDNEYSYKKEYEKPIKDERNNIYFLDMFLNINNTIKKDQKTYADIEYVIFEIKTENEMKDWGDVLRQIKKYRILCKNRVNDIYWPTFILITPILSDEVKQVFKNENILTITTDKLFKQEKESIEQKEDSI